MNIPDWATDVLRFEGGTVVYYNKEQWEFISDDEVDRGKWLAAGDLDDYLVRVEAGHRYTHETVNISLENK